MSVSGSISSGFPLIGWIRYSLSDTFVKILITYKNNTMENTHTDSATGAIHISAATGRIQEGKVLYTAKEHTTGGRDGGSSRSSDGRLEIKLSVPGTPGSGTNPEQLFAAGWSACFIGAMKIAAGKMKVRIPADVAVDAEVDLCLHEDAYFLQARLNISLPGLEREVAQALADAAHQTCPYSKATRGNIDVQINVI
jgi:Ohr subfamily peroxiredoxin